jgi:hypothetical protein
MEEQMKVEMNIRAKEGMKIRNPMTGEVIPSDRNTTVPMVSFWLRRLAEGSVYVYKDEPKVEKVETKKSFKKEKGDKL